MLARMTCLRIYRRAAKLCVLGHGRRHAIDAAAQILVAPDSAWVTLLLVLINVVVYLGYQRKDDALVENAVRYDVDSGLGALEAQAHAHYLEQTDDAKVRAARQAKLDTVPARQRVASLAHLTTNDVAFAQALRSGTLFKDEERVREWRGLRAP